MADEQSTQTQNSEPPEWYKNPPEWLKNLQTQTSQSTNDGGQTHTPRSAQELIDSINALPEKIVQALRESFSKTTQSTNDKPADSKNQQTDDSQSDKDSDGKSGEQQHQTPGKKTFAQWWFGS